MFDTIAAIATAPGGAIGIIRLSGEQATQAVDAVFAPASGKTFADCPPRMLIYGALRARWPGGRPVYGRPLSGR